MNQQEQTTQEQPSKETMIAWMQEQIEFKKIQAEMQELDTRIAVARAEYMKAMYTIAQISAPVDDGIEHTLTKEDLEQNPELKEEGLNEGDVVRVPTEKKRGLKK